MFRQWIDMFWRDVDVENIGLRKLHLQANVAKSDGEKLRVGMILREAFDIVFQRVEAGCRKDSDLPHPSSQSFSPAQCGADDVVGTQEHRACRRAQSLRQANRYR